MAYGKRFAMEPQKTLAFGSISGTYAAIGTATTEAVRLFFVQNLTNATLQFSIDGVNDHIPLLPNASWTNDIGANKFRDDGFDLAVGTIFYVKTIGTPTAGSVYVSLVYGE